MKKQLFKVLCREKDINDLISQGWTLVQFRTVTLDGNIVISALFEKDI